MKRSLVFLTLACSTLAAYAGGTSKFVGIWAAGKPQDEGPALFLYPNGKAYFNAMCGSAVGTWKAEKQAEVIAVDLREDESGPGETMLFQLVDGGHLVRRQADKGSSANPTSIASEILQALEKTTHQLPTLSN